MSKAKNRLWRVVGNLEIEDVFLSEQAETEGFCGHLAKARELSRRAVDSAQRAEKKQAAALLQMNSALREAAFGNLGRARQETAAALALATTRDTQTLGALVLALAGDAGQAQRLASDLSRRLPEATYVRFIYLPTIRAALALRQGKPLEAIENLRVGSRYELTPRGILSAYLRGEAYLSAHQGAHAAAEFQKVLDHPGLVGYGPFGPIGPLAHLGLGRAYAMQGDAAKARAAYQDFFGLWKDADPDIPIFKQAQAEYAKLR